MNAVAINELKVEYNILCLTSLVRNIQICFRSQNTVILFEMNSLYNRMAPGMRVTGKFGPLVPNPKRVNGRVCRRVRAVATGVVIEATNQKTWSVKRNQDPVIVSVKTNSLKKSTILLVFL